MLGRFLRLLHEGVDHDQPPPLRRKIDGTGNPIPPMHPYFPEFPAQVVDMRLPDFLRTKLFQQLGNMHKARIHIRWKIFQLPLSLLSHFYMPCHKRV